VAPALAAAFAVGVAVTAAGWTFRNARRPVVAPAPAPVAAAAPSGGTLFVASEPAGASVSVDGKALDDKTPMMVAGLAPGKHAVTATLAGRTTVEQHTTVAAGQRVLVQLALPAASHPVRVETVPSGAFVYVDGVLQVGQTPLSLTLANDEFYNLRIEKNGFELTSKSLTPDDHDPVVTVNLPPEKMERGTLMLDSDIVAEVWVDGENSGLMSPTVFQLPPGDHQVQLREGDEAKSPMVKVKIKVGQATHTQLKGTRG
jgi:hypothetical protein